MAYYKPESVSTMSRINFRVDERTKDAFKDVCESEGKSMSEVLEDFVREKTGHSAAGRLPDDPQLAKAYEAIYWAAGGNPVEIDDAEATVANKLNIQKAAVRSRIIRPLQDRGYLTLRQGISKVHYRPNVDLQPDVFDAEPATEEAGA